MDAALIRAAERWRGLRMTVRAASTRAIREGLDRAAHIVRMAPTTEAAITESPTRFFGTRRLDHARAHLKATQAGLWVVQVVLSRRSLSEERQPG
jgi:hypothetical protein